MEDLSKAEQMYLLVLEIILEELQVRRLMAARRYWQVQMTEILHREELKRRLALEVQHQNLVTASLQSAHGLVRKWNSHTADSTDDCLQFAF